MSGGGNIKVVVRVRPFNARGGWCCPEKKYVAIAVY